MEESETDCKEGSHSIEKQKRRLKTPAQVEALEKFYNEHNYPNEPLKLQFAKEIGLSVKQVSSWFCHRRLKDKNKILLKGEILASANQNLSSGDVQDHISGLKQESCSSTKHGDWHIDHREVESRQFYGYNTAAVGHSSDRRDQSIQIGHYSTIDDRSSGSSSSPERLLPQDVFFAPKCPAGRPYKDADVGPSHLKRGCIMKSAYQYLQAEIENPAVSAVKRLLGAQYREDGPPLGVDFDPLPPGAFDSPIRDSNCEPYFVGLPFQQNSGTNARITTEPKVHDKNKCEMLSNVSFPNRSSSGRSRGLFDQESELSSLKFAKKYASSQEKCRAQKQVLFMDKDEDSAHRAPASDSNIRYLKHRSERATNDRAGHHFQQDGWNANNSELICYPQGHHDDKSMVFHRSQSLGAKVSKSVPTSGVYCGAVDRVKPKALKKRENIPKERGHSEVKYQVESGFLMTSEKKIGKKLKGAKLRQQDHFLMGPDSNSWRKSAKRYAVNFAASLSEDETGGPTSSVD